MSRDLPENLRLLCSYHASIAEVCRKLNVNRSQFNRYLSGQTLPSLRSMRKMCDFFGVEEAELLMPHGQFKELVRLKPMSTVVELEKNVMVKSTEKVLQGSRTDLDAYTGYYFTYYNSMSHPGLIIKGLSQIYRTPFSANIKTLELIGEEDADRFTCKYEGACYMLGDRLFITAMEMLTKNEVIQVILYPSYTKRIRYLTGIMTGVAAHAGRPPAATRIAMEYLGTRVNLRKCLNSCGLFEYDDAPEEGPSEKGASEERQVPKAVQRLIRGEFRQGTHLMEASQG